jgi:hypothetical protein
VAHKTARPIPVEISAQAYLQAAGLHCYLFPERLRPTELQLQRGADPSMANVSALVGGVRPRKELA